MRIDHDAVLEMWELGATSPIIAETLGLADSASARAIVIRARKKGDKRAKRRQSEVLDIEPHIKLALIREAKRQKTTPSVLLREAVNAYFGVG